MYIVGQPRRLPGVSGALAARRLLSSDYLFGPIGSVSDSSC